MAQDRGIITLITLNYKNLGAEKPFELVIFQGGSGETDTVSERKIFADTTKDVINIIINPVLKQLCI